MATVPTRSGAPTPAQDGLVAALGRLARLELELGAAELRRLARAAGVAAAAAALGGVTLVAALVVLLAAALAPLVGARGAHLALAGGAALVPAVAALAWGVGRLRALGRPRLTLTSVEETWRWLGAQLRSRLTLR